MENAIISGATGAIGTALIQELINNNVYVLVITRKDSARNDVIPKHKLVTIKYCDLENFSQLQNDTGREFDVFYHFAWSGTFGDARNDLYLQNENVKYALDAVHLAQRFGCHTFIGAGSQAEYGRVEGKLKPDTPTFPENGYGIAKLCAGQMTRIECEKLAINHIWVRILSVYGPNDNPNSMIMSTIAKLKNGDVPKFTKGEQMWDYLYSGDAARVFYLLWKKGKSGKIYVLGSGKVRPLYEYIEDIRSCVNTKGKVELGAIPYSDKQVMYLCADTTELENDLNWYAETSFSDGILKIIK
jgi:nucleoside-diphosphate-sugar epimerase